MQEETVVYEKKTFLVYNIDLDSCIIII